MSSPPNRSCPSCARAPRPSKKKGASVGGFIGNLAEGLKDLAVASGPGLVELGKFVASTPGTAGFSRRSEENERFLRAVERDYRTRYGSLARGDLGEFAHELYEKPVPFALDALTVASAGAGTVGRGAAVSKALKAGTGTRGAARALRHGPTTELRRVKVPIEGKEVEALLGTYSRSALTRSTQKWLDGIRERFPNTPVMGRSLYRKIGFQQKRLGEVGERFGRAGAEELLSIAGGRKLTAAEHRALRVVGEGVPLNERIAKHVRDLAAATDAKQAKRLRGEIRLLEQTRKHLDDSGTALATPRLADIYEKVKASATRREELLAAVDELAPTRAAARRQAPAAIFQGRGQFPLEGPGETYFTYADRARATSFARLGASKTIRHPRKPGTTQTFTGKAIEQGRIPRGEAILAAEAELEAWRFTTILRNRDRLIQFGKELPEKGSDVALVLDELEGKTLPAEVKALLGKAGAGEMLAEEQLTVLARVGEGLRQTVFPGKWDDLQHLEQFKTAVNGQPVPGVLWVDERLLGGLQAANPLIGFSGNKVGRALLSGVDAVNNATKMAILYLLPLKYITPNALSQVAFALIQQGFAAPRNLAAAVKLHGKLGAKAVTAIDAGMGEGFAMAIAGKTTGPLTRGNLWFGRQYGKIIDLPFRRAAALHEMRRAGYETPTQISKLLFDKKLAEQRNAIFLEANSEIIDYARLGKWERNVIKRVVFFYPWVKGASVYGARMFLEHPAKTWAIDQLGKIGSEAQDETLGSLLPAYAEALAPFGDDTTLNLASVSPFTTPYAALRALSGDIRPAYSLAGSYSPAINAAAIASGFTAPGGYEAGFGAAGRELYEGLPAFYYGKRLTEKPSDRQVYPTTTWQELFTLLFGPGVVPRTTSRENLEREAKRGR